jgi:two-component system chemotaxis response regulator CheB
MPPSFTESLAKRLDRISGMKVQEAKGRERILPGQAFIAPGGFHLLVKSGETSLTQTPPVHHVRPAADVMMESAAAYYKSKVIGVILTGMGRDGTAGMAEIKKNGGRTIVQDPATAVISSMPQSVIDKGLADVTVPLGGIAASVIRLIS